MGSRTGQQKFAYDAFASHRGTTHGDEVRALVARLRAEAFGGRTFDVFFDEDDVDRGSVVGELEYGLSNSRHLLACMTPAYFQSPSGWTFAEWHAFLYADPDGRTDRVIPVLIADCEVPMLLKHLKVVDLREPRTDTERARYSDQYARLVRRIKDEPRRPERRAGQIVEDGELAPETLVLERAMIEATPDAVRESLRLNLIAATEVPRDVWAMPIRTSLAREGAATLQERLPDGRELQNIARAALEQKADRPYLPGFRRYQRRIVTFDPPRPDHPLATIADVDDAQRYPLAAWMNDPNQRRIIVELWNKALRSHANRIGLRSTIDQPHRFFFERLPEQDDRRIDWRGRGPGRTVTRAYRDDVTNDVNFWFHRAGDVRIRMLGRRTYLRIRPTVVFTRDGTTATVRTGPAVTALARPFTQRDRNANVEYLVLFWAWVLGSGQRNVRIKVSGQELVFDARLVELDLPVGIADDQTPIAERLDEDDTDTELGSLDASVAHATQVAADAADEVGDQDGDHDDA